MTSTETFDAQDVLLSHSFKTIIRGVHVFSNYLPKLAKHSCFNKAVKLSAARRQDEH